MIGYSFPTSIRSIVGCIGRITVLTACCMLGACASIGLGGKDMEADMTTTGSIGHERALLAGIDPSDWDILLNKISSFDMVSLQAEHIEGDWDNPATGSKGRITQVKLLPSLVDQECRSFKSSMHRVTGVENIEGQICRAPNGNWLIIGFATGASA